MKTLEQKSKKSAKSDREHQVLVGLVEHYIQTGKPVGSNVLKDVGFENLSSATIRNYFAHLEEKGFLAQQHSSGGRIPTDKAFRLYATEYSEEISTEKIAINLKELSETRTITTVLQQSAEELAKLTHCAVFLSAPRFEQDFIIGIKLVIIDTYRCLCIVMTDFGEIKTEILYTEQKLGALAVKRLESYFNWRLTSQNKPENLSSAEEELAQKLYNELLVRYIVGYSSFNTEDLYRTGFSSVLNYPEFQDPSKLSSSLALFENTHGMRLLLKECSKYDKLKFWMGSDLVNYSAITPDCAVIAIPYYVNNKPVGSVGLFGPLRLPYRFLFAIIRQYSDQISSILTNSLYKFKITLKQPKTESIDSQKKPQLLEHVNRPLIEDQRTYHLKKTPKKRNINQSDRRK